MAYCAVHHIVKETCRRIEMMDLPYEDEYRSQLKYLGFKEKEITKVAFLRQEWNIGSARVLGLLQEANILAATEFILSIESNELTQQIMNDLLETEFQLLANIIQFAHQANQHSQTLANILKECFGLLLAEFKDNPNAIPSNYLVHLKEYLHTDEISQVKQVHLDLLLTAQDSIDSAEAISKQDQWRREMQSLNVSIFGDLIVELVADKIRFINMIKQWMTSTCAISLKYTLYALNLVSRGIGTARKEVIVIKEFMKFLFRSVVDTGLMSKMQMMLLFAREICATNEAILGTYSQWYKQTIGEMTYNVKKDQFISAMEMLTAKCNDYVSNYKQLCRAHISQLKSPDVTIVLDD